MSKKQTRQNRGARTGGHDRGATTTDAAEQAKNPAQPERTHPLSEASHKQPRKFGHN
ncbi:hypothetical protein ACFYM2_10395 [Streptomyces sp. NPDC006711]|uniref:hypothetical protein n=1 Tax=unclassified Streptomyces TaxID=2593676 RepID=UPI0033F3F6E3